MPLAYVLITPARNEAAYIEATIQSMIAQTVLPLRWVIVSDGSTDGTDEIVEKYMPGRPWLELVKLPPRAERNFAAKVLAFRAGYERVKDLPYEVIGNIDADVSFPADYFAFLLERFEELPDLGDAFDSRSDLVEAGLSSLAAVQMLLAIEERTGVWVDESELTPENLASAEALARCVHAHVVAAA